MYQVVELKWILQSPHPPVCACVLRSSCQAVNHKPPCPCYRPAVSSERAPGGRRARSGARRLRRRRRCAEAPTPVATAPTRRRTPTGWLAGAAPASTLATLTLSDPTWPLACLARLARPRLRAPCLTSARETQQQRRPARRLAWCGRKDFRRVLGYGGLNMCRIAAAGPQAPARCVPAANPPMRSPPGTLTVEPLTSCARKERAWLAMSSSQGAALPHTCHALHYDSSRSGLPQG